MQDQQQNNATAPTSGSTPQSVGTTAAPAPSSAPTPTQSVAAPSREGAKSGKGGLLFKVWILPILIICIPAAAFYVSKEVIFVDRSTYEAIDNHFKNVMKFDGKEYSNGDPAAETTVVEPPAAKEAAAEISASEAPAIEKSATKEPANESPATESPTNEDPVVVEEAIVDTDVSEGKISR